MTAPAIKAENIVKTFQEFTAVDNVSFDVSHGHFFSILGPSGCGKTTLLRMIAGLEEVTSGDLYIDGQRVNDLPPKDRDIAIVFQNYALYPHMSVYDNMAFGLKLRKMDKGEIRRRVPSSISTSRGARSGEVMVPSVSGRVNMASRP